MKQSTKKLVLNSMLSDYTVNDLVWAFNEWQRRYIDAPEEFESQWETIRQFLSEDKGDNNDEISVGHEQAAYLLSIIDERD